MDYRDILNEAARHSEFDYPSELPAGVRTGDHSQAKKDEIIRKKSEIAAEFKKLGDAFGVNSSDIHRCAVRYQPNDISRETVSKLIDPDTENFDDLVYRIRGLSRRYHAAENLPTLAAGKMGSPKGISAEDAEKLLDIIKTMTSASYQRLDAKAIPLLRKFTVVPASLPRYVYRGLFYDGHKIKDRDHWLAKWKAGSYPKERPGKATSWSSDIGVALSFMDAQDRVRDRENGFMVLLRYDISRDQSVVVADLRNIPQNKFWSQQEILLSKDAIDYEVMGVFSSREKAKEYAHSIGNTISLGGHGENYVNALRTSYFLEKPIVRDEVLQQWRSFKNLTLGEVIDKVGSQGIIWPKSRSLLFPLSMFCQRANAVVTEEITQATCRATIHQYLYGNPLDLCHAARPGTYSRLHIDASITLVRNEFNAFLFDIEVLRVKVSKTTNHDEQEKANELIPIAKQIMKDHLSSYIENRRVKVNIR